MALRLTRRQAVVAAAALTMAVGSAGAYAVALPDLPVESTVGKVLDATAGVLGHVVAPAPDDQPPSDGVVTVPGSDTLPLPGILGPTPAPAPAPAPGPAAAPKPTRQAAAAAAPAAAVAVPADVPAPAAAVQAPGPAPSSDDSSDAAAVLEDLFGAGPLVSAPNTTWGEGWSVCNNNNLKRVVNDRSDGSTTDIEQNNSGTATGEDDLDCH